MIYNNKKIQVFVLLFRTLSWSICKSVLSEVVERELCIGWFAYEKQAPELVLHPLLNL